MGSLFSKPDFSKITIIGNLMDTYGIDSKQINEDNLVDVFINKILENDNNSNKKLSSLWELEQDLRKVFNKGMAFYKTSVVKKEAEIFYEKYDYYINKIKEASKKLKEAANEKAAAKAKANANANANANAKAKANANAKAKANEKAAHSGATENAGANPNSNPVAAANANLGANPNTTKNQNAKAAHSGATENAAANPNPNQNTTENPNTPKPITYSNKLSNQNSKKLNSRIEKYLVNLLEKIKKEFMNQYKKNVEFAKNQYIVSDPRHHHKMTETKEHNYFKELIKLILISRILLKKDIRTNVFIKKEYTDKIFNGANRVNQMESLIESFKKEIKDKNYEELKQEYNNIISKLDLEYTVKNNIGKEIKLEIFPIYQNNRNQRNVTGGSRKKSKKSRS